MDCDKTTMTELAARKTGEIPINVYEQNGWFTMLFENEKSQTAMWKLKGKKVKGGQQIKMMRTRPKMSPKEILDWMENWVKIEDKVSNIAFPIELGLKKQMDVNRVSCEIEVKIQKMEEPGENSQTGKNWERPDSWENDVRKTQQIPAQSHTENSWYRNDQRPNHNNWYGQRSQQYGKGKGWQSNAETWTPNYYHYQAKGKGKGNGKGQPSYSGRGQTWTEPWNWGTNNTWTGNYENWNYANGKGKGQGKGDQNREQAPNSSSPQNFVTNSNEIGSPTLSTNSQQ